MRGAFDAYPSAWERSSSCRRWAVHGRGAFLGTMVVAAHHSEIGLCYSIYPLSARVTRTPCTGYRSSFPSLIFSSTVVSCCLSSGSQPPRTAWRVSFRGRRETQICSWCLQRFGGCRTLSTRSISRRFGEAVAADRGPSTFLLEVWLYG